MNPLINAYRYKINQLNEKIEFISKQNSKLRSLINEIIEVDQGGSGSGNQWTTPPGTQGPDPQGSPTAQPLGPMDQYMPYTFPGNGDFPHEQRSLFLQRLWERLGKNPTPDQLRDFEILREILRQMTAQEWNDLMRNFPKGTRHLDAMRNILSSNDEIYRNLRLKYINKALQEVNPTLARRFSKWVGKASRSFGNFGKLTTILLLLLANANAYGDNFEEWLEQWLAENENNPNPEWPDWGGNPPEGWEELIPPDVESDTDGLPSMLPPSNTTNTTNTAPELPGGSGAGSSPIDPDVLM